MATTEVEKAIKQAKKIQLREGHKKLLLLHLDAAGLPHPVPEYQFHDKRKWKIDFAWPEYKLAVEVEGGIYGSKGGGHRSISGFEANLEKYNQLAVGRWFLIRLLPEWLDERRNEARELIQQFFASAPRPDF